MGPEQSKMRGKLVFGDPRTFEIHVNDQLEPRYLPPGTMPHSHTRQREPTYRNPATEGRPIPGKVLEPGCEKPIDSPFLLQPSPTISSLSCASAPARFRFLHTTTLVLVRGTGTGSAIGQGRIIRWFCALLDISPTRPSCYYRSDRASSWIPFCVSPRPCAPS